MKIFLLSSIATLLSVTANSQVFWTEAFQNGCASGCFANVYVGPNGAWTQTPTGFNDTEANKWFVSGAECGNAAGQCGSTCGGADPSLHVGADDGFVFDPGAAYDAGGLCGILVCVTTNMRVESPVINCTGYSNITLSFNYIEYGQGTTDDATLWYDDGTGTWTTLLSPLAKTSCCNPTCGGGCTGTQQGCWTAFSIVLPASANNNPNVKIGFNWTNNDDGVGTDPSFAVDDITLSVVGGPPPVASFSVSATTICVNGCVNFTDLSSNSPTSWSWTFPGGTPNNSVAQNPNNICYNTAGTYTATLTATNANGSSSTSQTITVNPLPTANAGTDVTICQSASTTLTATGGTSYVWSPVTGLSNPNISNPVASPTISTNYTVTVTNSCGSSTDAVNVTVNSLPTANAGADVTICESASTTLAASGGTSYVWSPVTGLSNPNISNPVASPTISTNYTVTVTNSCGSSTDVMNVTVNPLPVASAGADVTICGSTSTTLAASGGISYLWSPVTGLSNPNISNPVASPTLTTNYTVTVSNSCGSSTDVVNVTVTPLPVANAGSDITVCLGTNVTLTASGGSSYSWWNNGSANSSIAVSPTTTTAYTVTATNSCGSDVDTVNVVISSSITAVITGNTTICQGQSTTLNASGGVTYSWLPTGNTSSSIVVTPTSSTSYSVIVSAGTCSDTASVTVIVNPLPVASAGADVTICESASTTLSASGGTSYVWSPVTGLSNPNISNPVATPTITTNYSVTVTNSCGSSTDAVNITVNPLPIADAGLDITVCPGTNLTLTASGGSSYSWWNNGSTSSSIAVSPATTTGYTVTATNSCGSDVDTVNVVISSSITAGITGNTTICQGQSTTLNASGGVTYSWLPAGSTSSSIVVNPTAATSYSVIAFAGPCSDTASVTVNVLPSPTVSVSGGTTICAGDIVTLSASGGTTYSWWNNGSTASAITVSPSSSITYTVTGTNASGCSADAAAIVTVVTASVSGNNILCEGQSTTLTASGGTSYSWIPTGATSSSITVSPSSSTTYSVIVSAGSCTDTASVSVTVNSNPTATASPDTTITEGATVTLSASGGGTYSWSTGSTSANIAVSPSVTTVYCVTVTNANNCTDIDCVTVTVEQLDCADIFVPTAFSPNNDGQNELECVLGDCIETFSFAIYDRWGEKVFETDKPEICWDGTYKGKPMNSATFVYYLEATLTNGEQKSQKGNVSLIR